MSENTPEFPSDDIVDDEAMPCPACGGYGYSYDDYGEEVPCDICDGCGMVPADEGWDDEESE